MKKNGFVYKWVNLTNEKKYIGYHVGCLDDGYVSSSHNKSFWGDFKNKNMIWERQILFTGDSKSCLIEEQKLLKEIDIRSDEYYNNARGSEIIFTDEVKKKMSVSGKKRWNNMSEEDKIKRNQKISKSKKGKPRSSETIQKMKDRFKSDEYIGIIKKEIFEEVIEKIVAKTKGQKRTQEFKQKQSERFLGDKNPMFGKTRNDEFIEERRKYMLENNPGKNKTEETKKRISESKKGTKSPFKGVPRKKIVCPHCNKKGGEGLMHRWHFDNCKFK